MWVLEEFNIALGEWDMATEAWGEDFRVIHPVKEMALRELQEAIEYYEGEKEFRLRVWAPTDEVIMPGE